MTLRSLILRLYVTAPCWVPSVLLIVFAANQLRLARFESLSPWSGGGFGMFSSTDSPGNRHLHAFIQNEGIRREIVIPIDMRQTARRATTLPTRRRLKALAMELAEIESRGSIRWDEIDLQVWAVVYDPVSLSPGGKLLKKERFLVEID